MCDTRSSEDNLGDQFRIHLEQISDDFRKLESRIRSLERENADLKSPSGKSKLSIAASPVKGLEIPPVVFQGERPDDTLENQFQEAFGENYQNRLPASPDKNSPASAKYQKTKTISRSDSGDL